MKIMDFSSKIREKISSPKKEDGPESKNLVHEKIRIDEMPDEDYESVKISKVGVAAPLAIEGVVVLTTDDGKEFPITAFSGEVASYISNFLAQKHDTVPTIYNMLEHICEENEIMLVKVKVYESGKALRANLYFTGKKDLVLRNFRASDAVALATFYNVPILLRKSLLERKVNA